MIPYMVGKFAPNSTHLTRGLVKYVPGTIFVPSPPKKGTNVLHPRPPPIVERVCSPVKWLTSCWKTCGLFVYYSAFARGCPSRFSGGLSHGLWYSDHRSLAPRAAAPRSTASCTWVSRSQSCPLLAILADLHLTSVSRGRDHSALLRW